MDRLVIIGNGFDLAHGLKTSYLDFISLYLLQGLTICSKGSDFEDELIKIKYDALNKFMHDKPGFVLNDFNVREWIANGEINSIIENKSIFFQWLISDVKINNWVDVEYIYFRMTLYIASMSVSPSGIPEGVSSMKKLNKDFEFFKLELEKYLFENCTDKVQKTEGLYEKIYQGIRKYKTGEIGRQSRVCFLNFNYTNTIKLYADENTSVINIHGQIKSAGNPIIFGWGDDTNDNYIAIENLNSKEYLKNLKSIAYLNNSNYKSLMSFIESERFEVFIVGHSCGLSDRTLLKTIFQSTNCYRIKIFYYAEDNGNDDFTEKTIEMLRHFSSKEEMRRKIESKMTSIKF